MDMEEKKRRAFFYLHAVAENRCCIIENFQATAAAAGLTAGQLRAALYVLCGEGSILQEGNKILLLE